jgi:hypothetical protein
MTFKQSYRTQQKYTDHKIYSSGIIPRYRIVRLTLTITKVTFKIEGVMEIYNAKHDRVLYRPLRLGVISKPIYFRTAECFRSSFFLNHLFQ